MKGIVNDGGKCSIGHIYFYSNEKVYRFTEERRQSRIPYVASLTNLVLQRHVTPQNTRLRVPDDIIIIVARRTYFDRFKQGDVTRHESVEGDQ